MKTSELTGAALDWAVAKCENRNFELVESFLDYYDEGEMHYAGDWAQGGPIIERENISITGTTGTNFEWWECDSGSYAHIGDLYASGPTPLIAAMRAYVASKLGDEIEIPAEVTA